MFRRLSALGVVTAFLFAAGCSDDSGPVETLCSSLPQAPQILPNAQAGVVPFRLLTEGNMQTMDIVFVNGGQDPLVVSDVRVEGDAFTLVNVTPDTQTVECAEALAANVRFTAPTDPTDHGRGVHLGSLVVESNAGNFSTVELELVGPSAGSIVPNNPDIAVVESPVEVQEIAGLSMPAAVIRYYNLGGDTLVVDSYTIDDTANFRFLSGTEVPGASCEAGADCVPVAGEPQGCCGTPQLACVNNTCASTRVVSGEFVLFGVRFTDSAQGGSISTQVNISSNDPDTPDLAVGVSGTP